MKSKRNSIALLACGAALLILGCSSGGAGGSSSPTTGTPGVANFGISGSLGTEFQTSLTLSSSATQGPVDQVMAVPTNNDTYSPDDLRDAITASVSAEGDFEISLPTSDDRDWILLLLATSLERKDQIQGYVALSDLDDTLIQIPASAAQQDLALGTLSADGDEAVSETTIDEAEATFSLTADQLRELARTDNLLKAIKNVYINYDGSSSRFISVGAGYSWTRSGNLVPGQLTHPSEYDYQGFGFTLSCENCSEFTWEQVRDKATTISVYPPEPITVGSDTWDAGNPFENDGTMDTEVRDGGDWRTTGDGDFSALVQWDESNIDLRVHPPVGDFLDPPPDGLWTYELNGTPFAYADVGVTDPFDENGNILILLPAVRLATNGDNQVTQVDVQFYRYSRTTGSFSLVTDLSMFEKNIGYIGTGFADLTGTTDNGGTTKEIGVGEEEMVWENDRVYWRPAQLWGLYTGVEDDSTYQVETVGVSYRINSIDFGVEFRPVDGI